MTRPYSTDFYKAIRFLRKKAANHKPFIVRTVPPEKLGDHDGDAIKGSYQNGVIKIARGLDEDSAFETLVHELAHHLDDSGGKWRKPHRDSWGKCYAKIYRALMNE